MKYTSIIFLLACLFTSCSGEPETKNADLNQQKKIQADFSNTTDGSINWLTFEAYEKANEFSPRPLLIDTYTDWCKWCKVMDESTFSNPKIASYINNNYYPVKFNAETTETVVFQGVEYGTTSIANRQYSALADQLLENDLTFPSLPFLNASGEPVTVLRGFQSALDLEPMLVYFGEGYSTELTWSDFIGSYESQL